MDDAIWYFAYGSNMDMARLNEARLKPRGVAVTGRVLGRLPGWKVAFNKPWPRFSGGGAANIMRDAMAVTYGTLNRMPPEGLSILDEYEGVAAGHYERQTLRIERLCPDAHTTESVEAIAYIARGPLDETLLPPRFYLDHLLAGRDLLPSAYTRWLASHQVLPILAEV